MVEVEEPAARLLLWCPRGLGIEEGWEAGSGERAECWEDLGSEFLHAWYSLLPH